VSNHVFLAWTFKRWKNSEVNMEIEIWMCFGVKLSIWVPTPPTFDSLTIPPKLFSYFPEIPWLIFCPLCLFSLTRKWKSNTMTLLWFRWFRCWVRSLFNFRATKRREQKELPGIRCPCLVGACFVDVEAVTHDHVTGGSDGAYDYRWGWRAAYAAGSCDAEGSPVGGSCDGGSAWLRPVSKEN
jgi:hypothetical protein